MIKYIKLHGGISVAIHEEQANSENCGPPLGNIFYL